MNHFRLIIRLVSINQDQLRDLPNNSDFVAMDKPARWSFDLPSSTLEPVLIVVLLTLGGGSLGLAGLLTLRLRKPSVVAGVVLPCVIFLATIAGSLAANSWRVFLSGSSIAIVGILIFVLQRWHVAIASALRTFGRWQLVHVVILLFCAPISAALVARIYDASRNAPDAMTATPNFDHFEYVSNVFTKQPPAHQSATDRGTLIPVYAPRVDPSQATFIKEYEGRLLAGMRERILRTGPIDERFNCHGWVFTDGLGWLNSPEVAKILAENEYTKVDVPKPGDIIVYRAGPEYIHTGIVRIVEGSRVIIESKWSMCGRFLHAPEDQPYATEFSYYRTNRPHHVVRRKTAPAITGG
jgi:hypothetical protein